MSDEKPTSLWKKELSFKRKPVGEPAETALAQSAAEAPTEAASVWKKEISLRRKPKADPAPAVAEAVVEDAPVPVPAPVAVEPEPVAAPPLSPEPEIDHSWLTQPLELVSDAEEPPPADAPAPPPVELPAPPPLSEPLLPAATVLPAELDPALTFPADPAPLTEPSFPEPSFPGAVAVPVPELTVPPVDLDAPLELPAELLEAAAAFLAPSSPSAPVEEKQSLLKRELSLGRGAKARKPAKAKRQKPAREPSAEKASGLKRELSFRKRKPEPAAAPEEAGWDETDKPKPFYKRELSFGRSKVAAAEAPTVVQAPASAQPAAEKVKRERPKLRRPPVPKPMIGGKGSKKLVGLKVGASQIAAATIVNGAEPELVQVAREPLDAGIVVGGELRDPEALAVALREFFRKHGLPKRGVRLGIANNRIGVRTFDVAGIDDPKQLANAIRFRAQEVLPIPIEEAVLDYHVLSESRDEAGVLTRRVLLVVAYRELVDRYVSACQKAGIQIVGIDLEAFALLRALAEPRAVVPGDDRGALVAVSVGHDRSTFAVSDGRICEFTRVLEWGGWAMNVAIARALDLSPGEAEPVKRALSFSGGERLPEGFNEGQLELAREAARKQLQSFARELVSSLQFYQNQPGSLGIGEIVLTGGTTHLPGFAAELERLIGVPVRVGDPLARVKVSKKIRETEQAGSYAIAIGLGIED